MFKTGCCGEDFATDRVGLAGLMTLSMPLILLAAPLNLILLPFPESVGVKRVMRVLLSANLELVRRAALIPGPRCSLAGRIYPVSPRLSGAVYKFFNLFVLALLWALLIGAAVGFL